VRVETNSPAHVGKIARGDRSALDQEGASEMSMSLLRAVVASGLLSSSREQKPTLPDGFWTLRVQDAERRLNRPDRSVEGTAGVHILIFRKPSA
jgi:hypothetical protein